MLRLHTSHHRLAVLDTGIDTGAPKTLRVGDLAKRAGKSVRAIHLYEELGLLQPTVRSKGGYRLYGDESVLRVRWITKLQEMGFSLNEIRKLVVDLEQKGSAPSAMKSVQELFEQKLEETRFQMLRLRSLEEELKASLHYLHTCENCDPETVLDACTSCELHDCRERTPELVAGFRFSHKGLD